MTPLRISKDNNFYHSERTALGLWHRAFKFTSPLRLTSQEPTSLGGAFGKIFIGSLHHSATIEIIKVEPTNSEKAASLQSLVQALKNPYLTGDFRKNNTDALENLAQAMGRLFFGSKGKKYVIIDRLGEGNSGTVYQAWDLMGQRDCAIKVFKLPQSHEGQQKMQRAEAEREMMSELKNPHLLELIDHGTVRVGREAKETPFIVMLLMEQSVHAILKQNEQSQTLLPAKDAIAYTLQILAGLKYMHSQGKAHRDIKPENIFIRQDAGQDLPTLILSDFGVSKDYENPRNITRSYDDAAPLLGTLSYMGPECRVLSKLSQDLLLEPEEEKSWGIQTDIFAVGIILYRMLTNQRPIIIPQGDYFNYAVKVDKNIEKLALKLATRNLTPKQRKKALDQALAPKNLPLIEKRNIPTALFEVVSKALAFEPRKRYKSVDEFISDLENIK
jgi:serine/threonine-protein kinase